MHTISYCVCVCMYSFLNSTDKKLAFRIIWISMTFLGLDFTLLKWCDILRITVVLGLFQIFHWKNNNTTVKQPVKLFQSEWEFCHLLLSKMCSSVWTTCQELFLFGPVKNIYKRILKMDTSKSFLQGRSYFTGVSAVHFWGDITNIYGGGKSLKGMPEIKASKSPSASNTFHSQSKMQFFHFVEMEHM